MPSVENHWPRRYVVMAALFIFRVYFFGIFIFLLAIGILEVFKTVWNSNCTLLWFSWMSHTLQKMWKQMNQMKVNNVPRVCIIFQWLSNINNNGQIWLNGCLLDDSKTMHKAPRENIFISADFKSIKNKIKINIVDESNLYVLTVGNCVKQNKPLWGVPLLVNVNSSNYVPITGHPIVDYY